MKAQLLWWGRCDPKYSRNGVLRQLLQELNIDIVDFHPHLSRLADIEAMLKQLPVPDAVWVPCFRQRDVEAAHRWCRRHNIPLIFDPLISSYDKQLFERFTIKERSINAKKLLNQERKIFSIADHIIADTSCHAQFFKETLGAAKNKISVIYVGAEEKMFKPQIKSAPSDPIEIFFYGSYIPLHGVQTIIDAAHCYDGAPARWCMLGNGPERAKCEKSAKGLTNFTFEPRIPYNQLPARIHQADILLGVFGTTDKAGRVMPNKIFQALAAGRPVITQRSNAYPAELQHSKAIRFIEPGNPEALAQAIKEWSGQPELMTERGSEASSIYKKYLSSKIIKVQLKTALTKAGVAVDSLQ